MSDPCEDICDAILESIQEAQEDSDTRFSLAFTADKPDDPNAELDKPLDGLRLLVWPHGETEVKTGRVGQDGSGGQVQLQSELWSAEAVPGSETIGKGDHVEVVEVKGLRLKVRKK